MFKVQPVRSKELQAEIAKALGVDFFENTYAFFAVEVNENATAILSIIGMCQFEFSPDGAIIKSIAAAPNKKEDEAIFIMVRTVMNFCYRAELPTISAPCTDEMSTDSELIHNASFIQSLGFRESNGYVINLKDFYKSPCHYNNENV